MTSVYTMTRSLNPLEPTWTSNVGYLPPIDDKEDDEEQTSGVYSSEIKASWGWSAGSLDGSIDYDDEEEDEWDFGSTRVQEEESLEQEETSRQVEEDPHEVVKPHDDSGSATSATYTGDSFSSASPGSFSSTPLPIQEDEILQDGPLEHAEKCFNALDDALEKARRSLENRQSLRISQVFTGLSEDNEDNASKNKKEMDVIESFNWDEEDDKPRRPLLSSSFRALSQRKLSQRNLVVDKKKLHDSAALKNTVFSSMSVALMGSTGNFSISEEPSSPVKSPKSPQKKTVSEEKTETVKSTYWTLSPEEEMASPVKTPKTPKERKTKSKSPKRECSDKKKKDKKDDSSSVVTSKSKKKTKKPSKSKSLSPTPTTKKQLVDKEADAANKKLEATVGVVSTPPKRRKKKSSSAASTQE